MRVARRQGVRAVWRAYPALARNRQEAVEGARNEHVVDGRVFLVAETLAVDVGPHVSDLVVLGAVHEHEQHARRPAARHAHLREQR